MNRKTGPVFSRRQFARRAAGASAAAVLTPPEALLLSPGEAAAQQASPQLSPQGQLESETRYQQVLSLYGSRLDDTQKANLKRMCADLQPTLERIRKFSLENGNAPALFLKPLVERDKKPQANPKKP